MSFLLDTNVISETARPQPDAGVMAWLAEADESRVFLSIITLAELRHGVERLAAGVRRTQLDQWLTGVLPARFGDHILPVDEDTADLWGCIIAKSQNEGRTISAMDAFIAATALRHGLTLVTRNVSDFEVTAVRLFNPWTDQT